MADNLIQVVTIAENKDFKVLRFIYASSNPITVEELDNLFETAISKVVGKQPYSEYADYPTQDAFLRIVIIGDTNALA